MLALLPVPKFVGVKKKLHGVLENRLIHACMDFVTAPLKVTAKNGAWMSDYAGYVRRCFTPLAAYIADTPEAATLTGVAGKTSHLTMASFHEFGDPFRHPPRMAADILTFLDILSHYSDPSDVKVYVANARELFRLNGVNLPFWRDWRLPDGSLPNPAHSFPIETLHHLHKGFWDHDVKWIIRAIGDRELDTRFSLLQPRNGYRHFSTGISSLKQVTGREHRDIQRYILGLIADAVRPEFVACIRALLDLRYLSQLHDVNTDVLNDIARALEVFHGLKQIILDLGLRTGKKGNTIPHFEIPKLELLQSIIPSIMRSGSLPQWSADVTGCLEKKLTISTTIHRFVVTLIAMKNVGTLTLRQQSTPQPMLMSLHPNRSLSLIEWPTPIGSSTLTIATATAWIGSQNSPKSPKPMGHLDQ